MNRTPLAAVSLVLVLLGCQPEGASESSEASASESSTPGTAATDTASAAEGQRLIDAAISRRELGEYQFALEAGHEALRIAEATRNLTLMAEAHSILGIIENSRGEPATALRHGLEELHLREQLDDPIGLSQSLNNVGNSYRRLGEYEKALEYHHRSLEIKMDRGDQNGAGYSHHNIGEVLSEQGKHEEALESFERAEADWRAVGNRRAVAAALKSEGQALESLGRFDEALRQLRASLAMRNDPPNPHGEAETLLSLCRLQLRLGEATEAVESCGRAVTLAEQLDQTMLLGDALAGLAAAETDSGNLSDVESLIERQLAVQRQMRDQERDRLRSEMRATLAEFEAERNTERLEREAKLHEETVRRGVAERNLALLTAALLLVIAGIAMYAFWNKRRSEQRFRRQAEELEAALAEVRTLRGMLPLCAWCHTKVRDDEGEWMALDTFVEEHTDVVMTHAICPDCQRTNFPKRSS